MKLLWATRGRSWGFRFLQDGGLADPLAVYERLFAGTDGMDEVFQRIGHRVGLRFPDPLGRCDAAGRVIPHEMVLLPPTSDSVVSLRDALDTIWPEVAPAFAQLWALPRAPTSDEVELALAQRLG